MSKRPSPGPRSLELLQSFSAYLVEPQSVRLDLHFVQELLETSRGCREPHRLGDESLFPVAGLYPNLHYWPGPRRERGNDDVLVNEGWSIEIKVCGCPVKSRP